MEALTRADRERELLRYLRTSPSRLHAEYRRVLGIPAETLLPNGMPGAMLILGILDREYEADCTAQEPVRKPSAK